MRTPLWRETGFLQADLRESRESLDNPGCGWYHMYSFTAGNPSENSLNEAEGSLLDVSRKEQLAMALIDIGAYRTGTIPKEALAYIERILELFHSYHKQVILRFAYDTEGKGLEHEPEDMWLIKKHMAQLGDIVKRHASDILVLQGIFVGSWGEMHSSKYLTAQCMSELLESLYLAVEGCCYLAVRTPVQWRQIMNCSRKKEMLMERTALFNDGMFGSPTDLGTYGAEYSFSEGGYESMGREEELEWQSIHMETRPNGGEAVAGETLTGYRQAAEDMRKMHVSYLNSVWQQRQLNYWKEEEVEEPGCWKGLNGYEYIGCRLGYRFVVREARILKEKQLQITVENCGFAELCEETECFLIIEKRDGRAVYERLDTDARRWRSGRKTLLFIPIEQIERTGGGRLLLQLKRKTDGRKLYFANQGVCDRVLLGEYLP